LITDFIIKKREEYASLFEKEHLNRFNLLKYIEPSLFDCLDKEIIYGLRCYTMLQEKCYENINDIQELMENISFDDKERFEKLQSLIKEKNKASCDMYRKSFKIPLVYSNEHILKISMNILFAHMKYSYDFEQERVG